MTMTTSHEDQRYQALKNELRRLRRPSAPWYREGELHRRLHHTSRRAPFIGVAPILMIAATFVTISIAAYVLVINPVFLTQQPLSSPDATVAPAQQPSPEPRTAGMAADSVHGATDGRRPRVAPLTTQASAPPVAGDTLRAANRQPVRIRHAAADSLPVAREKAPVVVPGGEDMPVLGDSGKVK